MSTGYGNYKRKRLCDTVSVPPAVVQPLTDEEEMQAKDNWIKMRRLMPEMCEFMVELSRHSAIEARRTLAQAQIRVLSGEVRQ